MGYTFSSRRGAEFYCAFNGRDLALMEQNWESSTEVVMNNPLGGVVRGWPSIREVYERLFTGNARITVEFFDYTLQETGDALWAIGRKRGTLRLEGQPDLPLLIRTSRLFRRENGRSRWRQAHHHGSIDDAKLLADYQARVRGSADNLDTKRSGSTSNRKHPSSRWFFPDMCLLHTI